MKPVLNIIIPVAMGIAVVGLIFKLMHWPGANILIIIGLGTLAIQATIRMGLEEGTASKLGGVTVALLALGFLFKIMHWQGGQIMLGAALALGIVAMLLMLREKKEE